MKTISKLVINPSRVIKDDELRKLKGGSWSGYCIVICDGSTWLCGPAGGESAGEAASQLSSMYNYLCPPNGVFVGCAGQINCY